MLESIVTIAHRHRGPVRSGNGGYTAGLLARSLDGVVEVTLRRPAPLETPLRVVVDEGSARLFDGDGLVAEARPTELGLDPPAPPSEEQAVAAARATGWGSPSFAECFVCGSRDDGSGLGIHPGPVPGREGLVAAPWAAREVSTEVVWAAIDCPGAWALLRPGEAEPLLGRMTARVQRLPREGERCVVVGWPIGEEGRKLYAGTALYGDRSELLALARQTWILPR